MRRRFLLCSLVVLAVTLSPALAAEIVYFTNGSSMPVEAYSLEEDGTIRLDLGDQAYVAFPIEQIDRIETSDGRIQNREAIRANKIVSDDRQNRGSIPAHQREAAALNAARRSSSNRDNANIERDSNGIAVYRPFANHPAPNKRQFTTVAGGSRNTLTNGGESNGVVGATPMGGGFVISNSQEGKFKQPVGLQAMPHKPYSSSNRGDDGKKREKD